MFVFWRYKLNKKPEDAPRIYVEIYWSLGFSNYGNAEELFHLWLQGHLAEQLEGRETLLQDRVCWWQDDGSWFIKGCTEDVWHQTHSNSLSLFQGSSLVALIQAFYFNLKNAQKMRQSIGPVNSTWPWYRWTEAGQVDLPIDKLEKTKNDSLFVRSWYDNEWGYSNRLLAALKGSTCSPKSRELFNNTCAGRLWQTKAEQFRVWWWDEFIWSIQSEAFSMVPQVFQVDVWKII